MGHVFARRHGWVACALWRAVMARCHCLSHQHLPQSPCLPPRFMCRLHLGPVPLGQQPGRRQEAGREGEAEEDFEENEAEEEGLGDNWFLVGPRACVVPD